MKRHSIGLALVAASWLAGCGWYTNIPAQNFIKVAQVTPGRVTYEPPDTRNVRETKVEFPKVRFQGDPGAIGADFSTTVVNYRLINGAYAAKDALPTLQVGLTFRVDSSNYPKQPDNGNIDQATVGKLIDVGNVEIEVPVVTRHVLDYGLKTAENSAMVTAECTFTGIDDANLGISLVANVPIYFMGKPGNGL